MVFLDAYAVIALAANESAAELVEQVLRKPERKAIVSINLAEVVDNLIRREGLTAEQAASSIDPILDEVVSVVDVGRDMAVKAALIRSKYYKRKVAELSLADCVLLAAASGETVVTGDRAIADTCPDLETEVTWLE